MIRLIIKLCFLLLILIQLPVKAGFLLELSDIHQIYAVESKIYVYEDSTKKLDINHILSAKYQNKFSINSQTEINYGFTNSAYWAKFEISADTIPENGWIISSHNTTMGFIDFYLVDAQNHIIKSSFGGFMRGKGANEFNDRYFTFNLPLERNKKYTVFMRFESEDSMAFLLSATSLKKYNEKHYNTQMIEGFYFGTLLIMGFYNLFIFFAILDSSYLLYVLYILSIGMLQLDLGGWLNQYLLGYWPAWSSKAGVLFFGMTIFFTIRFIETFIKKQYSNSIIHYLGLFIKTIAITEMTLGFFIPLKYNLPFIFGFIFFIFIPAVIYSILFSYKKGYKPARFLIIGWSAINIGGVLYCLASFGFIPFNFFTLYGLQIGTTIELLFLSFALADRISSLRNEKQQAQQETIEQLNLNSELLQQLNFEQRKVFNAVMEGEENERKRLASELHDGLGQLLFVLKLNLSTLEGRIDNIQHKNKILHNLINLVDEAGREIRSMSHNLMSDTVMQMGLNIALQEFCNKINYTGKVKAHLQNINFTQRLSLQTETVLYRVIQETVNNSLRHSGATDIYIQLIKEDYHLIILIEDNGKGFDTSAATHGSGIGVKNIMSRVEFLKGKIHIDSSINKGTTYNIAIPL